jgi:uncharacterized protein (UPF0218 family)
VPDVVVELQDSLRGELKEPFGEIYTDAEALLTDAGDPIVAVGDVVTYHLLQAGRTPDVALIDDRTERSQVDEEISSGISGFDERIEVANPAATITVALLDSLASGVQDADRSTLLFVDGEEDLAALPAILLAPEGASIVYGQPGEGMVLVQVDQPTTERARELLSRMEGDTRRLWATLDLES